VELPEREPQLLGLAELAAQIVDAGVRDQRLEARSVAENPIDHVAAVGGARGRHLVRIHVGLPGDVVGDGQYVLVGLTAQSPLISSMNFWPYPVEPRGLGMTTTNPAAAKTWAFQR